MSRSGIASHDDTDRAAAEDAEVLEEGEDALAPRKEGLPLFYQASTMSNLEIVDSSKARRRAGQSPLPEFPSNERGEYVDEKQAKQNEWDHKTGIGIEERMPKPAMAMNGANKWDKLVEPRKTAWVRCHL